LVALEQVLAGPALDPVVAAVAEHGVGAGAGVDEVVAGAGERLVVVRAAFGEVLLIASDHEVVAGAGVDGVVPVTALEDVRAVEVGDDVVADAAEDVVVAAVAFEDVVALVAPEGVVVVAAEDPVDHGGAVVDRLPVDAGRVDGVAGAVLDRAVGLLQQQRVLVAGGVRVVRDRARARDRRAGGRRRDEVGELELAVGRRERVGLQGPGAVGV